MRSWRPTRVEKVFEHPLLELQRQQVSAGDEERTALVLNIPDWVNVIPLLPDGRVVMVRQWRYGVEGQTLEIPGGVVEPGEAERAAAERELLEETGYRGRVWKRLGEVQPNPAIQNNRTGTWLVTDLERIGEPLGDGHEELELEIVSLEEVPSRIAAGDIRHSLVVAAFYLLSIDSR
ncbi:MAG: NUDIX hydrolase [Acidobacteria bacterium]|nr:NUDIX hydrolase [Acidobacteriota bacterium]